MIQLFVSTNWEIYISGGRKILIYELLAHAHLQYLTRLMQMKIS